MRCSRPSSFVEGLWRWVGVGTPANVAVTECCRARLLWCRCWRDIGSVMNCGLSGSRHASMAGQSAALLVSLTQVGQTGS